MEDTSISRNMWDDEQSIKRTSNERDQVENCFTKIMTVPHFIMSRDSSVGIAVGYGQDDWGSRVRFPAGAGIISLHQCVQKGSAPTQPPIQWVRGAISLG
jgi:hypothetical protein